MLQVNAGYRLAAANALKHAFFEVCAWFFFFILSKSNLNQYFNTGLSIVL
jgi:hypothetical protein